MLLDLLPDGGPVYAETNLNNFIVEPLNMLSAFVFVLMAIYWFWKIWGEWVKFMFMTASTILLLIGGVGGTLYHGFRAQAFYMYMDWLPILIICIMASAYFLYKLMRRWYYAVSLVLISLILQIVALLYIPVNYSTNISYGILATLVVLPTIFILRKTKFYCYENVAFAAFFFMIALFARIIDPYFRGSIGTHFLWHIFGALSCFLIFRYVYLLYQLKKGRL